MADAFCIEDLEERGIAGLPTNLVKADAPKLPRHPVPVTKLESAPGDFGVPANSCEQFMDRLHELTGSDEGQLH